MSDLSFIHRLRGTMPWNRARVAGVTDALTGEPRLKLCKNCKHMRRDTFLGKVIPTIVLFVFPFALFWIRRDEFSKCGHPKYIKIMVKTDHDHVVDGRGIRRMVGYPYAGLTRHNECGVDTPLGFEQRAWWKVW